MEKDVSESVRGLGVYNSLYILAVMEDLICCMNGAKI